MLDAHRSRSTWLVCAVIATAAGLARADPAPPPGEESGRIDDDAGDSPGRVAARGVLFVPKLVADVVMYPIDAGIDTDNRYDISGEIQDWLTFDGNRGSIVPLATWETGLGFAAGARVTHNDLFGAGEHATAQATYGGTYRTGLYGAIDTGHRLGALRLGAFGNFERLPRYPFHGIGNESSDTDEEMVAAPINAFSNDTSVESFFRYQEIRAGASADVWLGDKTHAYLRESYAQLEYTHSTSAPMIDVVYDPMTLVGFGDETTHLYTEGELRWDTRRAVSEWEPANVHSAGSLVSLLGGYVRQWELPSFWHYGAELQHYVRVGKGPRVIVARFHGEAVTGNIADIPITELPMLGGGTFLRGYAFGRFRDRIAAVGSLQYMWSLMPYASAFVFTDVGRVYRDYSDLTLSGLHMGFGVGLDLYAKTSFIADLMLGSSLDGGIAVTAEFTPVLDQRPRWR